MRLGIVSVALILIALLSDEVVLKRPPIIDMHLHARNVLWTESDGTPKSRLCFPEPCFHTPAIVQKGEDILISTLEQMDKYNIVLGVLSYPPDDVRAWQAKAPGRFLGGVFMKHLSDVTLDQMRSLFDSGDFVVLGELALQYDAVAIDDPVLDPMFDLAEERDIPVHVHLAGLGGTSDFPIHLGNPLRLSKVLRKHPKLRVYLENAAWPFLEEVTSLMYTYPNVYADLSTITWLIPRKTFHQYLRGLMDNGLGKRLMFGSDQMMWPETIGLAIEAFESAEFLTTEEKRDIFYNNARRFLRLDSTSKKLLD